MIHKIINEPDFRVGLLPNLHSGGKKRLSFQFSKYFRLNLKEHKHKTDKT
jgi:hypothetical protein